MSLVIQGESVVVEFWAGNPRNNLMVNTTLKILSLMYACCNIIKACAFCVYVFVYLVSARGQLLVN